MNVPPEVAVRRQEYLRPHDVTVLLQLVIDRGSSFRELARNVGLSLGEAHNSTRRLELSRLLLLDERSVNVSATLEFVTHGIPYSFPAQLGSASRGIPTAFSAAPLNEQVLSDQAIVWPDPEGTARGLSLTPLSPAVGRIVARNPQLYHLLVLVDAMRIGQVRERRLARGHLEQALRSPQVG